MSLSKTLWDRAALALHYPDLVSIAAYAKSPTVAKQVARFMNWSPAKAASCQALAIIRRDYGVHCFRQFVGKLPRAVKASQIGWCDFADFRDPDSIPAYCFHSAHTFDYECPICNAPEEDEYDEDDEDDDEEESEDEGGNGDEESEEEKDEESGEEETADVNAISQSSPSPEPAVPVSNYRVAPAVTLGAVSLSSSVPSHPVATSSHRVSDWPRYVAPPRPSSSRPPKPKKVKSWTARVLGTGAAVSAVSGSVVLSGVLGAGAFVAHQIAKGKSKREEAKAAEEERQRKEKDERFYVAGQFISRRREEVEQAQIRYQERQKAMRREERIERRESEYQEALAEGKEVCDDCNAVEPDRCPGFGNKGCGKCLVDCNEAKEFDGQKYCEACHDECVYYDICLNSDSDDD